ncbi:hypothetical protein N1037_13510 [Phaeobacter sp. G2]|jgi:hypothetical protein|nr:hypothetical protein N1037_13510 [Phaeobacter sp. G2]
MTKCFFWGAALSILAGAASAQSLSVADLQAKIDAELSKGNEYVELLNDPDPARALKAMELMLESGDDVLVKAALDYGIYSPDKNVRNLAIKSFLDTSPRLEIQFDGKKADRADLERVIGSLYGLNPNEDGYAVTTLDIEGYDSDANCYIMKNRIANSSCLLKIVGEVVQYRSTDQRWYEMEFLDSGALTAATIQSYNVRAEVKVTIPLR